jgi:nucleotide-binding universal stress UspA family protein
MIHIERILYPTDFSSYSNQAYFHAVSLAKVHNASLTVLYVIDPEKTATPPGSDPESFWRSQIEQIRPLDTSIPLQHIVMQGDPASEIVRHVREARINLVVMGTHGRSGVDRLLMGSVAERVLRDAPCSVLVVKMPRAG